MTQPSDEKVSEGASIRARLRDWMMLCRAPNLFTAIADPLAGALICGAGWLKTGPLLIVMFASACFYTGGIMLNDWHDYKRDLVERPHRPLPSGRISRHRALLVGIMLLAFGQLLCSALEQMTSGIGFLLVVGVLFYDLLFKHVPIAPAIMGLCRALNLALGMSIGAGGPAGFLQGYLVVAFGVYVLGVTVFARREAGLARKDQLVLGAGFVSTTFIMIALVPLLFRDPGVSALGLIWLVLLAAAVGFCMIRAIVTPSPVRIQTAVKTAVLGIILLDAAMTGCFRNLLLSLVVAILIVPAVWAGKRLYST